MGNVALAVNHPGIPAPRNWEWLPLANIARMESGHTPSRERPEYWGGDIPWVGIKDAKRFDGGTILDTLECTNELGIANSSARVLPAGTVCLSRTASVGYVVKMGKAMATSQDFANWVCSERLDPDFLRYLLVAEVSALSRFSSGSVHQTIYYPELKAFHVCIPKLDEQKRIVAVLDQAFAALDRARAHAEANLADALELWEASLRSILDPIAGGDSSGTLSEIASAVVDCEHKTAPTIDNGYPSIRTPNVGKGVLDLTTVNRVSEETYRAWTRRATPEPGDLIMAREAPAGNVAVIPEGERVCLGQRTLLIKLDRKSTDPDFLALLLLHPSLQKQLLGKSSGATVAHVNMKDIRALPIPTLPKLSEQIEYSARLKAIRKAAEQAASVCRAKLLDISQLRQSLLQKAFSGELT